MLPSPGPGGGRLMLALLQPTGSVSIARCPKSCPTMRGCGKSHPMWAGFMSAGPSCGIRADPPLPSGCAMESRQDHSSGVTSALALLSQGGRPQSQELGAAERRASGLCPPSGTSQPSS